MKIFLVSIITFITLTISCSYGQTTPVKRGLEAITQDVIKAQLGFLSSDWTEGRMTGEKGEFLSADYIASILQLYGVQPAGDNVRMAGYGIINNKLKYNDFSKADVKGKFILKIAGIPLFMRESLDHNESSSMIKETESTLRSMGIAGIIEFNPASVVVGNPGKTIIVALWTAEEEGLLGSRYWIQNSTCPLKNVILNVNFDMISRYISDDEPNRVTMTYNDTNQGFKEMTIDNLEKHSINLNVDFQPSSDPPGGTDHRSFVAAGIPIMRFKPGHREEYHTPMDEPNTIDWDIMEKIIRISFANVWELANNDW
ncbi:MAG: M28 family peptidase [Bacteroidales bacterium]|nr:M28 family peptidase [Bacteroidales bacterium]